METYLVGGAVRDQLLQRPIKDRDWLVVGATPDDMLSRGYQQVGKDFPVFLHPETNEEYALARIERKIGSGYTGFTTDSSPDITLEQDLQRRDLTINALAQDEQGKVIDPYGGLQDLEQRQLRHVSQAFVEDPLRVFRVARFAARYHYLGFTIAPETMTLMQEIVAADELPALSAERVWQETANSLVGDNPEVYFQVLKDCGALEVWFPELAALWGVPNPPQHHPEVDTGIHTLLVLQQAVLASPELSVRFAALCHDLGKAKTPSDKWPSHHGHEALGVPEVKRLCQRLKVPNDCRDLALLVCENHGKVHRALQLTPKTIIKLFGAVDVWRKPERFLQLLQACESDARGRPGFEDRLYPQHEYLIQCMQQARSVDSKAFVEQGLTGLAIKEALHRARIQAVAEVKLSAEI